MEQPLYIMKLSLTERVAVYPDTSTYLLEDIIGEEYGVIVLDGPRGLTAVYGDTHHLEDDIRRLADRFYRGSSGWWDRRNRAIHMYLNLSGFDSVIHTLQGHSQGDWAEVVLFHKRNVDWHVDGYNILDTLPYVNAWFAGDIYSIVRESFDTYVNATDPDDTITRWNEVDAFHCQMMLDIRAELPNLAAIEFGIPRADWEIV